MKKIEMIGKEYVSKSGLHYLVEKEMYKKDTEIYYQILFLESQQRKIVEARNIRSGNVRDHYEKRICGVACKGNISTKPRLNHIAFKRWYAMIERCYNKNAISYGSYGQKGVRVQDRWLCFENFFKDIFCMPGFEEEKYLSGEIQLDKDHLMNGNKLYDKNTCVFLPKQENMRLQTSKFKPFKAISPSGYEKVYYSQSECARENSLTARTIGKVLNGEVKTHKGWQFEYVV